MCRLCHHVSPKDVQFVAAAYNLLYALTESISHLLLSKPFRALAAGPDESICASFDLIEGLCCPSSTGVSLPPVTEGDYCYICGSADVEMTKPDSQPYALGAGFELDDLVTCAEIEAQINDEREAGESCGSLIAGFTFLLSPSIWYVHIEHADEFRDGLRQSCC
mmetsp:Transcript_18151/g.44883  ORF Transcript_18151/g.44883 Transcript_18151/m.44883 type:complete len:164 (-) Transcript_18151:38-529(-)